MAGAFDRAGDRFTFVHRDRLWLSEGGRIRCIGAPAVDNVYRASWVSPSRILVSLVVPGEGDALGILDLAIGRFRKLVRGVHEEGFEVSRRGGLVVWRTSPPTTATDEVWMALDGGGLGKGIRVGEGRYAALAAPSPGGERVAGVSYGGGPCLHLPATGGAEALSANPGETAVAASWAPDGSTVAYLMKSVPVAASLSPVAAGAVASPPAELIRHTLALYRMGETAAALRVALPQPFAEIRWDAGGAGVFCRCQGDDPSLWYVPCASPGEPRRVYAGPVGQFVAVAGGHALATIPAADKPGLSRLFLLSAAGTPPARITNAPSFDRLDDVSSDGRKVLITRRPKDDRQLLFPEATLWVFELQ